MKKTATKKKLMRMFVLGIVMFVLLLAVTPIAFFASIDNEWQTRTDIKAIRGNLQIESSKNDLIEISKNDRVLEVIAVDKNGAVVYTLKGMSLFSDPNATVSYDNLTGLVKFEGGRISYLQRNSILGTLLNLGDDDLNFDDDDRTLPFDHKFVKDNTYQTIILNDISGNIVYIVCTQNVHIEFMAYFVLSIVVWSLLVAYFAFLGGYVALNKILFAVCPNCNHKEKRTNTHCTKCGTSFEPKHCPSCNAIVNKADAVCGKCGNNLNKE